MEKLVMCIDDSSSMRLIVKNNLESAGYKVIEAENGKDALRKIIERYNDNNNKICLFLVDVNMPEMNGFDFVKEIKKNTYYSNTPIVMLTTENSEQKKLTGKELGVSGWVVKPFDPDSLIKVINILTG